MVPPRWKPASSSGKNAAVRVLTSTCDGCHTARGRARRSLSAMLKPVELEIELFCRGLRFDENAHDADARPIRRTRAGLGSGLELILLGHRSKDIWVNVPVVERFAERSPFTLMRYGGELIIVDGRDAASYRVALPPEPHWYSRLTSHDTPMNRIGVLQGNYLGIYVSNRCLYWAGKMSTACKFCTTGANVGTTDESRKRVEDVIEVARAAQEESGSVFTHFNTGYHFEERADREEQHGLRQCEPYVRAVRQHVGGFIGVQAVPVLRQSYHEYDELIEAGTDHFSFCYV
jgi:hypothetical protein